ncbi:MAG: hypothetical protein V2A66_02005 [Pseudomonadota bacterium]
MAPKISPEIREKLRAALSGNNQDSSVEKLKWEFPQQASAIEELYDKYRSCSNESFADARRCLDNVISGRTTSSKPPERIIPTYKNIRDALDARKLTIQPGRSMAGNGAVKEFNIINRQGEVIANMFTLESGGKGRFDVLTPNGNVSKTFAARATAYQRSHPETEVILQVAAAFSSPDLEIDGFHLNDGMSVGWKMPNVEKYGGVVVITAAGPAIYNRNEIPKDGASSGDNMTIEAVAHHAPEWLKNADLFQAFTLVENGSIKVASPLGIKHSDPAKAARRVLVEREFIDAGNNLIRTWMIMQLNDEMNLYETARFVASIGAKNAALLDSGNYALGWIKDNGKHEIPLLGPQLKTSSFTSMLLIVAPSKEPR